MLKYEVHSICLPIKFIKRLWCFCRKHKMHNVPFISVININVRVQMPRTMVAGKYTNRKINETT